MNIRQFYIRKAIGFVAVVVALLIIVWLMSLGKSSDEQSEESGSSDHKNTTFIIDGREVELVDGYAEEENTPNSSLKTVTRYFGNELLTDLDGDGEEDDVAFVLTQDQGGSVTFFYAVAAINTEEGFKGSDGYLLGDRISPQSTTVSPNPRHKNVVVFNYADRAPDESMTTQPSVGKSVYLKVSLSDMRWGIVVPDFEGESREPL